MTDVEILPDGVIRVQVAEAEVHNINIRFLDRKTYVGLLPSLYPTSFNVSVFLVLVILCLLHLQKVKV